MEEQAKAWERVRDLAAEATGQLGICEGAAAEAVGALNEALDRLAKARELVQELVRRSKECEGEG